MSEIELHMGTNKSKVWNPVVPKKIQGYQVNLESVAQLEQEHRASEVVNHAAWLKSKDRANFKHYNAFDGLYNNLIIEILIAATLHEASKSNKPMEFIKDKFFRRAFQKAIQAEILITNGETIS